MAVVREKKKKDEASNRNRLPMLNGT